MTEKKRQGPGKNPKGAGVNQGHGKRLRNRKCLRCDRKIRDRYPGLCKQCKRYANEYGEEEEFTVHV